MKIRYIYSACIEIHTQDVCILTDPWFTDGAYDGSWYQFPKLHDPLAVISEPDVIYVSHIHPDHYDPIFLRKIFEKWGEKPILIPDVNNNYLFRKSQFDGINTTPITKEVYGRTEINIVPNVSGSRSDIDSALFVDDGKHCVLNLNDCIWNKDHVELLQSLANIDKKQIDLIALGYTGAGAYPQTYYDSKTEAEELRTRATKKKLQFFDRYMNYCAAFPSRYHLPFAGKYILGGKLSDLNQYRGIADAFEVTKFDDHAIILADFGEGVIDLEKDTISKHRSMPYNLEDLHARIETISTKLMDYEREVALPIDKINFKRMLIPSYETAIKRSEVKNDYYFLIEAVNSVNEAPKFLLNSNPANPLMYEFDEASEIPQPYSHIRIDYRYLFGLLTGIYHWDNAEIGSHYRTLRHPDCHNSEAQGFLNFLSVC